MSLNYNVRYKEATHISATDSIYFDNGTGILQQLVRSKFNSFLNYYDVVSNSVTTITTTNFYKLNSSTTLGLYNDNFTHTNNRITNAVNSRNVKAECNVSVSSGNNNVLHFAFYKNGVKVDSSEIDVTCSGNGKAQSNPMQCVVNMAVNDYLEVWISNESSNDVTLAHFNVIVTEL